MFTGGRYAKIANGPQIAVPDQVIGPWPPGADLPSQPSKVGFGTETWRRGSSFSFLPLCGNFSALPCCRHRGLCRDSRPLFWSEFSFASSAASPAELYRCRVLAFLFHS